MIVTKAEFADMMGVAPPTVSTWISRSQLSAPALLSDGRIDVEAAKQQLAERVDLARSLGRAPGGLFARVEKPLPGDLQPTGAVLASAAEASPMAFYADQIRHARGDLLEVELDRKKLLQVVAEGRLTRAEDFTKALMRDLDLLISGVNGELPDWVAIIRGATADGEALSIIGARLDRIRSWLIDQPP